MKKYSTNITRYLATAMIVVMGMLLLTGCNGIGSNSTIEKDSNKMNVVATTFPVYDFIRAIAGDQVNLTMLMTPGAESHSFEPTPQNIREVNEADFFVYVGGDSDSWVETIMDSVDQNNKKIVTLMDCVELLEEEVVEGMTETEHEHEDVHVEEDVHEDKTKDVDQTEGASVENSEEEIEYDEHVWTSPRNTILIVEKLTAALCEIDAEHAAIYQTNSANYIAELEKLDRQFIEVVEGALRHEIVVGDRFPFLYFAKAYGLDYYAAFPGCVTDSEPSAATIAYLTDKVREEQIPVVLHIELSNEKVCNSICKSTGAKSMQLNAVHNITKEDFNNGVTYLDLMRDNVETLREALY